MAAILNQTQKIIDKSSEIDTSVKRADLQRHISIRIKNNFKNLSSNSFSSQDKESSNKS